MSGVLKTRVCIWTVMLLLALGDIAYFVYRLSEHRAGLPPVMGAFGLGYSLYHFNLLRLGAIK